MKVVIKRQNNGRLSFPSSFSNLFCDFFLFPRLFCLSVFCWVHALTIKVDEVIPKLRRNGGESQITDLQRDSQNPDFSIPCAKLPLCDSPAQDMGFGRCTPSAWSLNFM